MIKPISEFRMWHWRVAIYEPMTPSGGRVAIEQTGDVPTALMAWEAIEKALTARTHEMVGLAVHDLENNRQSYRFHVELSVSQLP